MADVAKQEIDALQAEIDKIDFDGGLAPVGVTPAASTQDPPVAEPKAEGEPTPEPDPTPEPQPEHEPQSEPGGLEGEADPEPTPEPSDDGSEEDDKPALSDSHFRAALRMGMTSEEVSELYDESPELAVKTLAKCFEMVNATSKQLGQLGRAAQQVQATPEPAPQQPEPAAPSRKISKLIDRVREHYDGEDDPMADVLLELLKDRQQPVQEQPVQPEPQQPVIPQRTVDEEVAARQQINTFFAADDMTAYAELYGEAGPVTGDWSHLTPGQRVNRTEVCNRAQVLLYGAAAAGMEMSTAEALERAHLEVAAPMAEQIVRRRIAKSAKKRERGVTLQPNGNRTPDRSGDGKYNKDQAVDEMAAKLKEVFA